jgi:hypothetical protein
MASKTKVYFVLEFAAGGELLKKLVSGSANLRSTDPLTFLYIREMPHGLSL